MLLYVLITDLHFGSLKNGVLYVVWTAVEHLWIGPHGFPTERIETSVVLLTGMQEHSHLVDHHLAHFRTPSILHNSLAGTSVQVQNGRGVELTQTYRKVLKLRFYLNLEQKDGCKLCCNST